MTHTRDIYIYPRASSRGMTFSPAARMTIIYIFLFIFLFIFLYYLLFRKLHTLNIYLLMNLKI